MRIRKYHICFLKNTIIYIVFFESLCAKSLLSGVNKLFAHRMSKKYIKNTVFFWKTYMIIPYSQPSILILNLEVENKV